MWQLTSPGGRREISVWLSAEGGMEYSVAAGGTVCATGTLGLATTLADFTAGLCFVGMDTAIEIDESYSLPTGKKAVFHNHCMEARLRFSKDGLPLVLVARAYNNGAAFRYEIPCEAPARGTGFAVRWESTAFSFPEGCEDLWLQDWVASYEGPYNKTAWGPEHNGRHYGMPALLGGEGRPWVMVNEANVLNMGGSYCVSHLKGTAGRRLALEFAPEEKGQPVPSVLPFQSPWRYLLVEDTLDGVVNSTLNYNLNPPSLIEDTSWIKPARALWSWWCSDTGAQVFTEVLQYVDYAAAMGFEAVVVDAGWDESWIKQFCVYARQRGVSPWLWTAMQSIGTYEAASHYLPLWKSWGIDGVKIDIFENDSAYTAWQYSMMADIMRKEKLMINFHGCTKPMGEGRTWPHFIAAEGIMGLEYYKWSDMPTAEHNCTVPFTRNAVGPMDYTPAGFTNANRNTSMAHQMALAAVFESGCTHYASSIFNLQPWEGTNFLRRTKPKYDGLRMLAGHPGSHVAMLRWVNATEEYVVGCICNQKRALRLPLDFLPSGEFEAELYRDNRFGDVIIRETLRVTKDTVLDIPMPQHGGAGLYITRKLAPLVPLRAENYMCDNYTALSMAAAQPFLGSVRRPVSDEHPQAVLALHGGATLACAADIPAGYASLRLFYCAGEDFSLQISDGVSTLKANVPASGHGLVFAAHDILFPFAGGPARLVFTLLSGAAPLLDKVHIIQNHPAPGTVLPVETALLYGGGALLDDPHGTWQLAGLTEGSELRFNNVMAAEAGSYILRINYFAGPTGMASVRVNKAEGVPAKLTGVGTWGGTKPGDALAREVLVTLQKGTNQLTVVAQETLPSIKELVLRRWAGASTL